MTKGVFLDRDGTLNALVFYGDTGEFESPRTPGDFHFLPGIVTALMALQAEGWLLFLVSNQPSYAKGKTSLSNLQAIHSCLEEHLLDHEIRLQSAYYCYHHPNGIIHEYTGPCECLKPAVGA